jgi:hypothetical protein
MKQVLFVAFILCSPLAATVIPGPVYSGDAGGYNITAPDTIGPNYVLSGMQVGLTLPDGLAAVSFNDTGTASASVEVAL